VLVGNLLNIAPIVRRSGLLLMAAALSACIGQPVKESEPVVMEKPASVPANVLSQQEIRRRLLNDLLFQGLQAVDADHLSEPYSESAVDYFGQVLDIEPDNKIAKDGMARVVQRYLSLADAALATGARHVARGYLDKAKRYGASQTELHLRQIKSAPLAKVPANEFLLSEDDLDLREDAILLRLTEVAVRALRANSRITIVARSDEEGRWIYQRMREVLVDYRLRGNIVQGVVPKIILIDLVK